MKNTLDKLTPSIFNLYEFKQIYKNNEVSISVPWFFNNFDKEGFSIYLCEYQYNYELGPHIYKTVGLINGFFQRLERLRKLAFASMIIFGEGESGSIENQSVSGIWVFHGKDLPDDLKNCDDSSYYEWNKLDSVADRQLITDYFTWEGQFGQDKKTFIEGKIYK